MCMRYLTTPVVQVQKYMFVEGIKNDNAGRIRMVQLFFENDGNGFRYDGTNPFGNKSFLVVLAWYCSRGSLDVTKDPPEIGKKANGSPKQILAHIHNVVMLAWKVRCTDSDVTLFLAREWPLPRC